MMEKIISVTVYFVCLQYTSKIVSVKEDMNSVAQIRIFIMTVLACSLLTFASVVHTCLCECS